MNVSRRDFFTALGLGAAATALPDIHLPVRELPAPTDVAVLRS